ncbi:MAG: adenylate/guanylate cyclase domain-containing protein [Endomicrobia bacterium]|nr:adenylate/guanylate cyclase domain-containing protein [Endomicrobiia bacterium]MDW8056297.1 adenylate/guanylate cyclase domain-containing protein [Elusimicrobiota bacterium]
MKLTKREYGWILYSTVCVILVSILYLLGAFSSLENIFYDLRFKLRGPVKPSDTVVIVKIDEQSLTELGRWPWDRKIIAKTVENLFNAGVKVVGLDILFPEKSDKISDEKLAKALSKGNSVVAAHFEDVFENIIIDGALQKVSRKSFVRPIPAIEIVAKVGFVNIDPDEDGVVRKVLFHQVHNGVKYDSFNYKIAKIYNQELINVPEEIYVNYYGASEYFDTSNNRMLSTFVSYSFVSVYHNVIPSAWLKDKIVLIGSTATGLYDHYPTPFIEAYPGVEIHATIIENLLSGCYLTKPLTNKHYLFLIVLLGIIFSFLFYKTSPQLTILIMFLLSFSFYFITYYLFYKYYLVIEFVEFFVEVILFGFSSIFYNLLYEQREKMIVKNAFSKYINPYIMEELLNNPKGTISTLGGQKREITIVFTDIREFTTISEILNAEEIVKFLNAYFQIMNDIIFKYNGTIDKYIGDCIMFFWNAPVDQPDHAYLAVNCVIEMIRELERFNTMYQLPTKFQIRIGAGINTGEAIIGNIGSSQLMQYTAVGDTVNIASRLQQLTKEFKTPIILSEFVCNRLNGRIPVVPLGKIKLRGKEKEIEIYTIEGFKY